MVLWSNGHFHNITSITISKNAGQQKVIGFTFQHSIYLSNRKTILGVVGCWRSNSGLYTFAEHLLLLNTISCPKQLYFCSRFLRGQLFCLENIYWENIHEFMIMGFYSWVNVVTVQPAYLLLWIISFEFMLKYNILKSCEIKVELSMNCRSAYFRYNYGHSNTLLFIRGQSHSNQCQIL